MRHRRVVAPLAITLVLLILTAPAAAADPAVGGLSQLYDWPEETTNLVQNPGFEAGGALWQGIDGTFFSLDTSVTHTGIASLRLQNAHLSSTTPSVRQSISLPPGWYALEGWMRAENAGTTGGGGQVRLSSCGQGVGHLGPVNGTTDWVFESRQVLVCQDAEIRLVGYRKPDGVIWFDDIALRRLTPPVVEGFLRYPNYRGLLFEDRPQRIEISVVVRPEEVGLTLADLLVRASLETDDGTVLVSKEITPTAPNLVVQLDASAAPVGNYRLRLSAVVTGTGLPPFEYPPYRIVKLPASARDALRVFVDPDQVLVLGGQRVFPIGIFDTGGVPDEEKVAKIAEASIDIYLNYWLGADGLLATQRLAERLTPHHMWALRVTNLLYEDHPQWPGGRTYCDGLTGNQLGQDELTRCIAGWVRAIGGGYAGYYTVDEEPVDHPIRGLERVFHQYQILKDTDPGSITFIAQNRPRELGRWRDAGDVFAVDPYPIYGKFPNPYPEDPLAPLEMAMEWFDRAQTEIQSSRPFWGDIQFFKPTTNSHWPRYEELKAMSYMAIVAGAKGLIYWSYGVGAHQQLRNQDPVLAEEVWQDLVRVTREIKALEPVLLAPDAIDPVIADTQAIRLRMKAFNGARYLIAVNTLPQTLTVTFTLAVGGSGAEEVDEGRSLPLNGTTFTDVFGPYQTHVYRITGGSHASNPSPDTTAPTVAVVAPADGSVVGGLVEVQAAATDDTTVTRTDLLLNGIMVATFPANSARYNWDTRHASNGRHTWTARAYDAAGHEGRSAPVTVTVDNVNLPTVAIASPRDGEVIARGSDVRIRVEAQAASGVVGVHVLIDGQQVCTIPDAPYECIWSMPKKPKATYRIDAIALDAAGNVATAAPVTVTASDPGPLQK